MSKIGVLIEKMCPKGVVYKSIGEVLDVFNGYAFDSSYFNSEQNGIPIIRIRDVNSGFSNTYFDGKFDEKYVVNDGELLIGMDGDFRINRWAHGRALLNQRVCRLQNFRGVLDSWIFHFMHEQLIRIQASSVSGTVNHLSSKQIAEIKVPIPPIEVQQEIVKILDTFTELEAELEAELAARKTQYEFYRESLFGSHISTQKPLDSVASIWRGRRFVKDDIRSEGVPAIHYGEIYTKYGLAATKAYSFLDSELASKLRFVSPGDVVLVSAGETIEDIGKSFTWLGEGDAVIHDACYGIRSSEIDPRYMVHFFNTHNFRSQLRKYISSSKISAISTEKLGKVFIPVPSLEEQKVIANVLDSIDRLVSDLSFGLPGEINARRQQYEYFRGKLLTFKELEVA